MSKKQNKKKRKNNTYQKKQPNAAQIHEKNNPASAGESKQAESASIAQPEKFKKITADPGKQAGKQSKPVSKSLHADQNLEMLEMSKKERRKIRKDIYSKTTEGMTKKEKLSYFFDYYKWNVIIPIAAILFISYLSYTIYMNKRPVALGFTILNAADTSTVDLSFEDDYVQHIGMTGSYQFKESTGLDINYDYYIEHKDYIETSNSTDYSILSSDCDLGSNDIIISNQTGVNYCSMQNIVKPLRGYLSEKAYAALEPYMVSSNDAHGTQRTYAIDISSTQFAKDLNTGYSDVYVAFPGVIDRNYTNSLQFLEYVLGIDLSE